MKKVLSVLLVLALMFTLAACGGGSNGGGSSIDEKSAVEVMQKVWSNYDEADMFPIAGGDFDTNNMEAPDAYNIDANKDAFMGTFLVNDTIMGAISNDVATAIHMMNANTFCSAAMKLTDASKAADLAKEYVNTLQSNQWMCGMPDTVVVYLVGDYMVVAYGEAEIIDTFKANLTKAYASATALAEEAITA